MGCVTLDGFDQVRDQVDAALELNIDLRPCILNRVTSANESVVQRNADNNE